MPVADRVPATQPSPVRSGAAAARGRTLRRVALGFALAVGVPLVALAGLAAAMLDTAPAVMRTAALSPQDIDRVRDLTRRADPRGVPRDTSTLLVAPATDVDLVVHEAASRLLLGAARVQMRPTAADIRLSARVPRIELPLWLNVTATVHESPQGLPTLAALRVGRLPVPPALATWAARLAARRTGLEDALHTGLAMVQAVTLDAGGATARLRWDPRFADSLRSMLVPASMQAPLRAYAERLATVVSVPRGDEPVALHRVVSAMFQLAAARSWAAIERAGGSPTQPDDQALAIAATENRAALLTLALYTVGQPLPRLVPAAHDWPQPRVRPVLGAGREDHPQHLLVSAVLAAEGGGRLADAIGVLKEVGDRGGAGSGFSFDDLAADRAGLRLGQRAVRDPLGLQMRLREVARDADLLPGMDGLPSFLDEAQFRTEIGGEGSPRYRALLSTIESRVSALRSLN